MANHTQRTVNIEVSQGDKGKSDSATMAAAYPDSPIHSEEMTVNSVKKDFEARVLAGEVNDGGHTFNTHNRDFIDAPDMSEVPEGAASPYAPNPVSPDADGNVADAPEGYGTPTPGKTYGAGVGTDLKPKESSGKIASARLGRYVMGSSTPAE